MQYIFMIESLPLILVIWEFSWKTNKIESFYKIGHVRNILQTRSELYGSVTTHASHWYDIVHFEPHASTVLLLDFIPKDLVPLESGIFTYEPSHIYILKRYEIAQLIIFLVGTNNCHNHPFFWSPTSLLATFLVGYRLWYHL